MNQPAFIYRLKKALSPDQLPWVLTALRREGLIWECLQRPDFQEQMFAQDASLPNTWSPANIALTALPGESFSSMRLSEAARLSVAAQLSVAALLPTDRLRMDLQYPLDPSLRRRAARTFEIYVARQVTDSPEVMPLVDDPLYRLTQAALLALALRERRRLLGSWDGLGAELRRSLSTGTGIQGGTSEAKRSGPEAKRSGPLTSQWGLPLACLYGMVPDPLELLKSLLTPGSSPTQFSQSLEVDVVIHTLLSNPISDEKLLSIFRSLLAGLSLQDGVGLLTSLSKQTGFMQVQGVQLSALLAQDLVNLRCGQMSEQEHQHPSIPEKGSSDEYLASLERLLLEATAHRLAGQSIPSLAHLHTAWEATYHLQAEIAASQAEVLQESGEGTLSLPAWKQAVELAPGSTGYQASLIRSLWKSGRKDEAAEILQKYAEQSGPAKRSGPESGYEDADFEDESNPVINRTPVLSAEAHPLISLTTAQLSASSGDIDTARKTAIEALSAFMDDDCESKRNTTGNLEVLKELIDLLLELDLPIQAAQACQLALESYPSNSGLISALGISQFRLGRLEEAAQTTQLAAAIEPDNQAIRRQLAACLESLGEWSDALPERMAVLNLSEDNQEDLHAMAKCALLSGEADQAAEACRKAIDNEVEDGHAHAMLAEALLIMGDPETAEKHFSYATQYVPAIASAWLALARLKKEFGRPAEALETLRAGVMAAGESPEIYLELGEAYLGDWEGRGHPSPTQALAMFQNAANLSNHTETPTAFSAQVGLRLGQTLFQLGHTKDARRVLKEAYMDRPEHPGLAEALAETLISAGDLEAVVPVLRHMIEMHPEDTGARLVMARTLISLKVHPEEAVRCLEFVLSEESNEQESKSNPELHALLAEGLALCKDYPAALQAYQLAMESELVSDPAWSGRLTLGLGRVALALNQPDIAIAALEEAGQADPHNPQIQCVLCNAYRAAGLEDDALRTARQAIRLAPADVEILAWFAETIITSREAEDIGADTESLLCSEALNAFTRAVQIAPHQPTLLIRYGKVQCAAGEKEEAVKTFRSIADEEFVSADELHQAGLLLLELGDAEGAAASLEKALHLRGGEAFTDGEGGSEPVTNSIPYALILAYHRSGNPQAALAILEQTQANAKKEFGLRQLKADILVDLGRSTEALACIQEAIELNKDSKDTKNTTTDISLHFQAAHIARGTGDLAGALSHVVSIINSGDTTSIVAARTLAAELSRSMLQPDRAVEFLAALPEELGHDMQVANCLLLELALDGSRTEISETEAALFTGDDESVENSLSCSSQEFAHKHSIAVRQNALKVRLLARRGERAKAMQLLQEITGIQGNSNSYEDLYAVSRAALDLSQWDAALSKGRQAIDKAPKDAAGISEPLLHLNLAVCLLLRAEAVRLADDLEAKAKQSEAALSEHARSTFEDELKAAASRVPGGMDGELHPRTPILARIHARGLAAFQPCPASAQSLSALSVYNLDPEDAAAQIAALRFSQEIEGSAGSGEFKRSVSARPASLALQISQSYPKHPLVLAQLALTLEAGGEHPQEALAAARDSVLNYMEGQYVLPALGESPLAMLNALLARAAYVAGDLETSLQAIDESLKECPNIARWHALAARIRTVRGEFEQAVEHLEHAVELEPEDYRHYLALGSACLLVPSLEDNYSERAVETLEKAASIAPDLPEAWMALAEAYRKAGNLEKAASCCDRAIEIARQSSSTTDQAAPLILRAEIALRAGEPQEAFNRLQEAMKVSGEDQEDLHPILLLSRALDNLERPAEALAALETALPKAQEPLPLLLERVRLLRRSMGLPAALEALKDILENYPEEPVVLAALARAQAEAGQIEASTANAQRALQMQVKQESPVAKQSGPEAKQGGPSSGETLLMLDVESQADLHLLLGRLLRQSGQLDQALHHLNESIEKNPRMLDPYLELGKVLQERRQVSQALQVYNRATSVAPRDPRPYYQAGLALKEGKDYMGAEAMFRRAASLAPNDLGIHRQLGAVVALNLVHNRRRSSLDV